MAYQLRDYQQQASNAAVHAFKSKSGKNGLLILPTGSGKSLIIADIASRLDGSLLVLQPSKEILEQNYAKLCSYGVMDVGIFSASAGRKDINRITFAMIGSVMNKMEQFAHFKYVLIDECHLVNSKGGMYEKFINAEERVVIGLTATPYRLTNNIDGTSQLKFLTRTRPRIFEKVLYYCQVRDLLAKGYLAKLRYFDLTNIDMTRVRSNSTGAGYNDQSLIQEYERSGFYQQLISTVKRLLRPKSGIPRKGILVFTQFRSEAEKLVSEIPLSAIVTGDTPKNERETILKAFKKGLIQVVANVGVLTTGFDYPELDTVVMARPTKSLALYYQIVGRAIRPSEGKDGWFVDLCGNYRKFGKVDDLLISNLGREKWCVTSNGKQLTNVIM